MSFEVMVYGAVTALFMAMWLEIKITRAPEPAVHSNLLPLMAATFAIITIRWAVLP